MPGLSLEELNKMRETMRGEMYLGDNGSIGKITVHMGTCGIAAGAKSVESTFLKELENRGQKDIKVITTGCAGLCSKEPMATIELMHSPPVKYGNLNPDRVRKIVSEHIGGGQIVKECVIGVGSERGD